MPGNAMLAAYLDHCVERGALRPMDTFVAARALLGSLRDVRAEQEVLGGAELRPISDEAVVETMSDLFLRGALPPRARGAERRAARRCASRRSIVPALARYRWLEWRDCPHRNGRRAPAGRARTRAPRAASRALGEELGGLYIKLCQVAGARADVFPPVFLRELGRFHDRVTPRPFAELAPTLERELGRPLDEVFARDRHGAASRRRRSRRFTARSSATARPSR